MRDLAIAIAVLIAAMVFLAGTVADPPSAPPDSGVPVERGR